jgi:Fungal specific transcription factor domain
VKNFCPSLVPFGKLDTQNNPVALKFFQLAIKHDVYCHAMLCIAAAHFSLLSGQDVFKALAYHHRGQTIKLLNRILQEGNGEITEMMISVVASERSQFKIDDTISWELTCL